MKKGSKEPFPAHSGTVVGPQGYNTTTTNYYQVEPLPDRLLLAAILAAGTFASQKYNGDALPALSLALRYADNLIELAKTPVT